MIEIVHEDKDIVVAIKPQGTVSELIEDSPVSLPYILKQQKEYKEIYTVHRLDKDVCGLIVYAKNSTAAAFLSKQITDGTFNKEYIANVEGKLDESGIFEDLLFFDKSKNKSYVVTRKRNGVKAARLEYNLIDHNIQNDVSTVRIKLITGRTHQIRVQFASRKHPVVGDKKYGSSSSVKPIYLYSTRLSFISPSSKRTITLDLSPDWAK